MQAQTVDVIDFRAPARPVRGAALDLADLSASRPALIRFARRALRNAADVEDVVQETLTAAIAPSEAFVGRSSRMTWLMAILKHKIIDVYRRQARELPYDRGPDTDAPGDDEALFTPAGHWRDPPASWGSPDAALAQRDFMQVFEDCLASLPERMARAFTMRELMELDIAQICSALDITPNHCFVMLHRARMRLRRLLQERWFS